MNEKTEKSLSFFSNFLIKLKTAAGVLLISRDWRFLWYLVRGYVRVNYLGKNQVRLVEIFVTLACNAKCDFCSNGLFTEKQGKISHEKYLEIIDQCAALGVPLVALIGGEPLLYPKLTELVARIKKHGMAAMLVTNGILLTEDRIRELAAAGLDSISISMHSLYEKEHDAVYKVPGAYRTALAAKDLCEKYKISYAWATVVAHKSFTDGTFDRLAAYAIEHKITISVNPIIPTGCAQGRQHDLLLEEDIARLNAVSSKNVYITTHLTNNFFGFGCPAGNSYLGINATGEIFPCFFIPMSLGNVEEMTLRQAWEKACKSPLFKSRHKFCYAGVSREFISRYLNPVFKEKKVPIKIEDSAMFDEAAGGLTDLKAVDPADFVNYRDGDKA